MIRYLAIILLLGCAAPKVAPVQHDITKVATVPSAVKPVPKPQNRLLVRPKFTPRPIKRDTVIIRDTVFLKPPQPIKAKKRRHCRAWE